MVGDVVAERADAARGLRRGPFEVPNALEERPVLALDESVGVEQERVSSRQVVLCLRVASVRLDVEWKRGGKLDRACGRLRRARRPAAEGALRSRS